MLTLAEDRGFDVLVTSDRSIYAQQNLRGRTLAIVVLPTNRRRHVMERTGDVADTIRRVQSGQYVVIEPTGARPVTNYNTGEKESLPAVKPFRP